MSTPPSQVSPMMHLLYPLARRFIAGQTFEDALPRVQELGHRGFAVTLDLLGEGVRDRAAAAAALQDYLQLLESLRACELERHISIKLTQLGLEVSRELAFHHLAQLVERAHQLGGTVCVDMEGSAFTGVTLELVCAVRRERANITTVIQAMLHRSEDDVRMLNAAGVGVRLVKGAYKEPPSTAFQRREEIAQQFRLLTDLLTAHNPAPAIATHDPELLAYAMERATARAAGLVPCEFQMLYGIARKVQERVRAAGRPMRIYVPFGRAWLPYVLRRLRERKENIWFVVRHLFGD